MQTVLIGEYADGKRDKEIFDKIFSFDEGRFQRSLKINIDPIESTDKTKQIETK